MEDAHSNPDWQQNARENMNAREAARKEEQLARDAARKEEILLREAARKEDRTFRENSRQEDVAFRQTARETEQQVRRDEARLSTRRSALASAAVMCGKDTPTEKVLAVAVEFEAWINRQDGAVS